MNVTLLATLGICAVLVLVGDAYALAFLAGVFWFCLAYRFWHGDWPRLR